MKCFVCGGATRVTQTREEQTGTRRRLFCQDAKCGARFSTFEVVLHDWTMSRGHAAPKRQEPAE